ncbi:hypothetical protein KGQ20_16715 [Catenulispora sp. NF23]|uniref:hypothetical protein n=1 Tax=Catenulispora pinistramenti TaxID=2705254 RepID=UPI001BA9B6D6|nr:hypothetical protein [Catenulispora pinistramenti]MBS2534415.1 hypothetical protein [Catenulispora pinistramenti]
MTPTSEYPFRAETGGHAARRFHAEYGSPLPTMDLAARNTAAKVHRGAEVQALSYPPPAWSGVDPSSAEGLSTLLALLYGGNRVEWSRGGVGLGRSVPSGGGAYPGEVYVATEFGLCHYLPGAHALELLRPDDLRSDLAGCLSLAPESPPELLLLFTSRHDSNLARYGGFGHRLQALDTGVVAGQSSALLDAAGLRPRVHGIFDEDRLGKCLGLDQTAETVRAVVTAGPAILPGATTSVITRTPRRHTPRSGFAVTEIDRAQVLSILGEVAGTVEADFTSGADLHCVAGRVSGLGVGCHRFDGASGELTPGIAGVTPRELFAAGSFGELAGFEAACALLVVGDYEHGYATHGDRWYRLLNVSAGLLGLRISLAATGAGLAAGLRCDFIVAQADRIIGDEHPNRDRDRDQTVLLTVLIGHERAAPAPTYSLLPIEDGR